MSAPVRDLLRLPKWAQRHIDRLERDLAGYKAERVRIHEGATDVFVKGPAMEPDVPLPPDSTIRFVVGDSRFDVMADERGLDVYVASDFAGGLAVHPRADNRVLVRKAGR